MRVWVTRDEGSDGPLCTAFRQAGLEAVLEPVLERRVVDDCAEAVSRLTADDWLVLTSPFAINAVAAEPARVPRVAVVAESSRRAAELRGFRVELISSGGDGKSLFEALRRTVSRGRVCYPRSALVTPPACWAEVELTSPVLYETVPRAFNHDVTGSVDVVSVASPSAVNAIGPVDLPFASIGPSTSTALRQLGIEPWVEAPQPSFESLARVIADRAGA
ncbi:MAG: uroporphyrinogen-III synthase [Planctomycetes bacterium]|nr:uroporphyrinogen-III synthase [Planctomycetota bacterium]